MYDENQSPESVMLLSKKTGPIWSVKRWLCGALDSVLITCIISLLDSFPQPGAVPHCTGSRTFRRPKYAL